MSLPAFHPQAKLFSLAALSGRLFGPASKYQIFAEKIYPLLVAARSQLEGCYCLTNGRAAVEPVLLLAITLVQFLENIPDRLALELARFHAGWALALNQALGEVQFDPTVLVRFRERLIRNDRARSAFAAILAGLAQAGLVSCQHKQRLDSMYVVGKLARLNSLDCVRATLRLALQELEVSAAAFGKPAAWTQWWERYVEHQLDPRSSDDTLRAKLQQAGAEALALQQWIGTLSDQTIAHGEKVQLLARVLAEHFEIVEAGQIAPRRAPVTAALQNPHEPDATYACKGQGRHKKEVVGYKLQVAETVEQTPLAKGEPTRTCIVAMETQPAHASDEAGHRQVEAAQAASGLDKPPTLYVDAAYVSAERLAQAQAEGRALIGPAQPAPKKDGRFSTEDFDVHIRERRAVCPAGKDNTQCSRLVEEKTGKVQFRFEWSTHCHDCPLRRQCLGQDQRHRTLVACLSADRWANTTTSYKRAAANKTPRPSRNKCTSATRWKAPRANWCAATTRAMRAIAACPKCASKTTSPGPPATSTPKAFGAAMGTETSRTSRGGCRCFSRKWLSRGVVSLQVGKMSKKEQQTGKTTKFSQTD